MYPTSEVRWFRPGTVPDEAQNWHKSLGPYVEAATRTDRYLIPSTEGEPGIKLREGRIEVKARVKALGLERLASNVEAVVETFCKWSFPLAEATPYPDVGWIDVAKTRRVRTIAFEEGQAIEVTERPETGCDVELGQVRLNEHLWWTVCLEAFGPEEAARLSMLHRTAERVFASRRPTFDAGRSTGYVGWLLQEIGVPG